MRGKKEGCVMVHHETFGQIFARYKFFLLGLFIFSFLVRAVVFVGYLSKNEHYWQVDSRTYHVVATQIAQGHGISSADGSPHFYRLPGYPLFLGLYYKLFGEDTKNVLWPQIILASLIPMLVFLLAFTLFPGFVLGAKLAACWASVHLGLVLYAGFFMTESLFILFLLLFFIFFFSAFYRNNMLFWAGLFLGIASLFRPVGHYVLVVALLLLIFSGEVQEGTACTIGRKKKLKFVTFAIAWLLPVFFWLIRNFVLTGALFFHTLPGGHFLYLSAARVAMHTHHCSYEQAREVLGSEVQTMLAKKEQELGRPLLEIESCKVHEHLAITYFKNHPLLAVKNWCTDMFRAMFSLYSAELFYLDAERKQVNYFDKDRSWWNMFDRYLFPRTSSRILPWVVWGEMIMFLLILIGFAGFIVRAILCALRRKFELLRVLGKCLPFMALFIVIALAGGYARMRLPIEPLLIVLALHFWVTIKATRGACE